MSGTGVTGIGSPPLDLRRIIETFDRHRVAYLIVGGIATQLHGATRATMDFDALARFDEENLRRLAAAMAELGARIRAEGFSDDQAKAVAAAMVHPITFRNAELSTWMTDAGPVDMLHDIPTRDGARRTFDDLVERSTERNFAGIRVRIAGLEDIVASKEWANRPKDHDALPELRALLDRPEE